MSAPHLAMAACAAEAALEIDEVSDDAAFAALATQWNAAAVSTVPRNVFLRHEWFSAAWAWRRLDARLAIVTATAAGRVVGILPLVRCAGHLLRLRKLELLTVPDTQFADMIADEDEGERVADAFAAALSQRSDWDIATLDYLQARGAIVRWLVPALRRHRLHATELERGVNPFVPLDGSWSDYFGGRSRRLKKAVNLAANRLRRAGTPRIDWLTSSSLGERDLERMLDTLTEISSASWKQTTGTTLDREGPRAFIRALAASGRAQGWLSVWVLHLDERPVATELQLICDGQVHALRADYVTGSNETSPGTHLFRQLLEPLFDRGLSRYYLGPGDNPYKRRWADAGEPMRRVLVYNRTWRGRTARLRDEVVKPLLRTLRQSCWPRRRMPDTPTSAVEEPEHDSKP